MTPESRRDSEGKQVPPFQELRGTFEIRTFLLNHLAADRWTPFVPSFVCLNFDFQRDPEKYGAGWDSGRSRGRSLIDSWDKTYPRRRRSLNHILSEIRSILFLLIIENQEKRQRKPKNVIHALFLPIELKQN